MEQFKLKNIYTNKENKFFENFNLEDNLTISANGIYNIMFYTYKIGNFLKLHNLLYNYPCIFYYINKNANNLEIENRNKDFENKISTLLDEYFNSLKTATENEISKFVSRNVNENTNNNVEKLKTDLWAFINWLNSNSEEKQTIQLEKEIIKLVNDFLTENTGYEEFTGLFLQVFKEELNITKFELPEIPLDSFIFYSKHVEKAYSDVKEYYLNCYGEKIGNQIYGLREYANEHNNFYSYYDEESDEVLNKIVCSEKTEPQFHTISQVFKFFSILALTQFDETFNKYCDEYFESYKDLLINDSGFENFFLLQVPSHYKNIEKEFNELIAWFCHRLEKAPNNIQIKFVDYIEYLLSKETFQEIPVSTFLTKYFLDNHSPAFATLLKKNYYLCELLPDSLENLTGDDSNYVRILYTIVTKLKYNQEILVQENLKKIDQQKFLKNIRTLKLERNDFTPNDNIITNDDLIRLVLYTYNYLQDNQLKNKSAKNLSKLLGSITNLNDKTTSDMILDVIMEDFEEYLKISSVRDKVKTNLFNLEFADIRKQMELDNKKILKELKEKFYQSKGYDFENYYNDFSNKLTSMYLDLFDNSDEKWFINRFKEIINGYNANKIKNSVATAQYVYNLLQEQKMELTPIFICFIKAVEQFLSAFINYIVFNKKVRSNDIEINKKKMNILNVNWEKMDTPIITLEEYIKKNYFDYNKSLDENLKEMFLTELRAYRGFRNPNLHKDNIYDIIKVKEAVKRSYTIIILLVLLSKC